MSDSDDAAAAGPMPAARSGVSPALEARILRDRRREEKRRKQRAREARAPFEALRVKVLPWERGLL
jgi:hypothetical protein